jgi:hypothetical protein
LPTRRAVFFRPRDFSAGQLFLRVDTVGSPFRQRARQLLAGRARLLARAHSRFTVAGTCPPRPPFLPPSSRQSSAVNILPAAPPLRSGCTVNRDERLRREHSEDDQFAGVIYLRKGTSVSLLDKLKNPIIPVLSRRRPYNRLLVARKCHCQGSVTVAVLSQGCEIYMIFRGPRRNHPP